MSMYTRIFCSPQMDSLSGPNDEDYTALISMAKDFDPLGHSTPSLTRQLNFEDVTKLQPKSKIPASTARLSTSSKPGTISMKDILEKENEDKLVRMQLEKAEKTIAQLKNEIEVLERDLTSLRLRSNQETRELTQKLQVIQSSPF